VKEHKRILFILSFKDGRILASGSGTAADGIIALAGGVNAIEGFAGYKQLADEAVIGARPDVVLMMDRAGGHATTEAELFAHPALGSTPAGAARRLIRMDGAYLLGFGPRTADAIHDLAAALYGDAISD
jgi:iron complex transport system substrate-binding protein